jgi:hypothetical protein
MKRQNAILFLSACIMLELLISCRPVWPDRKEVYAAVLRSVSNEPTRIGEVERPICVKILESDASTILNVGDLRTSDDISFDPTGFVIDAKTKKKRILLVMAKPVFNRNSTAANLNVLIMTNKLEGLFPYRYSLEKVGSAWKVSDKTPQEKVFLR